MISALARAVTYTPPNRTNVVNLRKKVGDNKFFALCAETENSIKQAFCEFPDYGQVIRDLLEVGDQHHKLKDKCHIRVGIPVKPMLAKPTKGVQIVLQRFQGIEFTVEYKYDGFRG